MKAEERQLLELMVLAENQFSEEKKKNALLAIEIYLEALERCPTLARLPMEEKKELIKILREHKIL